jgi:hypothetical protein
MIPDTIFQTHRFRRESLPAYISAPINSWPENNPEFNHLYFDQEMKDDFMSSFWIDDLKKIYFYPGTMRTAQSDIFRICALYEIGGIYADSDLMCLGQINKHVDMRKDFSLEVSLPSFYKDINNLRITADEKYKIIKHLLNSPYPEHLPNPFLQNHFFACSPKHKFIEMVMDEMLKICIPIASGKHHAGRRELGVGETGPAVWCFAFLSMFTSCAGEIDDGFSIKPPTHNGLFIDIRGSITWNDGPFTQKKLNSLPYIFDNTRLNSAPLGDNSNKNAGTIKFHLADGHGCSAYE